MTQPTHDILRHWREAVPNDRMAHLIRDTERAFRRALQIRLAPYGVPFGHWSFLRILWETDGLTQKELSERAGVMEPTTFAAMKAMVKDALDAGFLGHSPTWRWRARCCWP